MAALSSTTTSNRHCLGRHVPNEILNMILGLVIEDDRTAVILPRPTPNVGTYLVQDGEETRREKIIVVCANPLYRVSKTTRTTYHQMFKAKAINMDLDDIVVTVEDLNFDYFLDDFLKSINWTTENLRKLMGYSFTIHLIFTEDFLYDPSLGSVERWLAWVRDGRNERYYSFNYDIKPIPSKYVEPLSRIFNSIGYARHGTPRPDALKLMEDVKKRFMSGQIDGETGAAVPRVLDPQDDLNWNGDEEEVQGLGTGTGVETNPFGEEDLAGQPQCAT